MEIEAGARASETGKKFKIPVVRVVERISKIYFKQRIECGGGLRVE
jgi:hypothetical protein